MSATPTRAFYLTAGREPVYALFDEPMSGLATDRGAVGVLLCPLFGNDDLCSYRARREWARTLAGAGHPTLRIDLPSTGDSGGGPLDPQRLDAWTDAVATAGAWLRARPGCERVAAIGVGLGGLLCYRAASAGAAIDDLVLWSVPARGRTLVRQLRALARMEASSDTAAGSEAAPLPHGAIASAGFVLSSETVSALEALDLPELELTQADRRRVLLLERDGLEFDARLRESIERCGAAVTVAPGPGYGKMVTPPQQSRAPVEVFARVQTWLAPSGEPSSLPAAPAGVSAESLELVVDGVRVRERPLTIARLEGRLVGVLAEGEEAAPVCAVLLNAGALRHIGPNRMWVETARRWAARGVPTLRIDLAGIGDSDGDAGSLERDAGLYVPTYVAQTLEVLDALAEQGLPSRFVLAGLCSGAYWAFHAALADERVRAAFMINPRALFWDPTAIGVREARNVRKVFDPGTWGKLARGQISSQRASVVARSVGIALRSMPARAAARHRARRPGGDPLDCALERLQATDTQLLGVFTAEEPVFEELERNGGLARMRVRANVRVEAIPGPLTSHTLEPLPLQRRVNALLDGALESFLAGRPGSDGAGGEHQLPAAAS